MTDDPEPVDYRHSEFYIASQQTKTTDGRSGTLPHLEYDYGAAYVHLHILIPCSFSSPAGGTTERGIGDTGLGVKCRFIQETGNSPMAGISPILLTHTGNNNKGLGAGGAQFFLPLWVQKKWGEWQSYGGGGYWISHAPDIKNHWFAGWQVQKVISKHVTLGGEIFHSTEQAAGQGRVPVSTSAAITTSMSMIACCFQPARVAERQSGQPVIHQLGLSVDVVT